MIWNKFLLKITVLSFLLVIVLIANSCTIGGKSWSMGYKMQGVNISSEIKSCGIAHFQNKAPIISPLLATTMKEKFIDKVLSNTKLRIVNGLNGDVNFDCVITDYSTVPISPQAGAQSYASQNRLTITVHVNYTNSKDSKSDFEKDFTVTYDFNAATNLNNAESEDKYKEKIDELLTNIFNQAFVNW